MHLFHILKELVSMELLVRASPINLRLKINKIILMMHTWGRDIITQDPFVLYFVSIKFNCVNKILLVFYLMIIVFTCLRISHVKFL